MATTTATGTTFPDQKKLEKQIQRQMGCMAGFLQLFDRHHLLTGKRIYSAKSLPSPSSVGDTASESGQSTKPPSEEPHPATPPRSDRSNPQLEISSLKTPLPSISRFEIKEGTTTNRTSWKFREAPRLSLDSRATTDSNGVLHRKQIRSMNPSQSPGNGTCSGDEIEKQRKSTSVIARLMGLEPLSTTSETESPSLRRSASESRVTRDLTHISLESTINYPKKQIPLQKAMPRSKQELSARPAMSETTRTNYRRNVNQQQQRIYYDSADFFPEPKQSSVNVYGEIEKRLKMTGAVDGSSKDLETLKHILEALQLKGLLHSNKSSFDQNFVYERVNEPPIVVMKPSCRPVGSHRSIKPGLIQRRNNPNESLPSVSPHRRMRNSISPTRSESSVKSTSSSSVQGRRQINVETHTSRNSSPELQRRVSSPVSSPKPSFRRSFDSPTASSPRSRRPVVDAQLKEKISLPLSDDSCSICSDEHNKGKTLLSRCDMLLQSIADMNSTNSSEQPSPISVLDPSFYKEDESSSSSLSPVPKRSIIDFKDLAIELEDEDSSWTSSAISTVDVSLIDDADFSYVADVLRAIACIREESDVFPLLEKQQCKKGKDGSNTSKLKRKLIFDSVIEILNRNKQLPAWKVDLNTDASSLPYIWSEFKKIREPDQPDQELFQVICSHLKKDLTSNSFDSKIEVAESVLDIERMVFKDLIGEAIRDLASSAVLFYPRRKLSF